VITPEVLDHFELALRNPPLDPISGQWHCVNPQDWIDFSIHAISRHIILKRRSIQPKWKLSVSLDESGFPVVNNTFLSFRIRDKKP
jgi:hypothetical protein